MARSEAVAPPGVQSGDETLAVEVAEQLVALSRLDVPFGDLYLAWAAARLEPVLGEGEYLLLQRDRAEVEALPGRLEGAVESEDWFAVREACARLAEARRRLDESRRPLAVAEQLREARGPVVDPFTPGLRGLAGPDAGDPEALRARTLATLERLERLDPGAAALYRARRAALSGAPAGGAAEDEPAGRSAALGRLKTQAMAALRSGDLDRLQVLSATAIRQATEEAFSGQAGAAAAPERPGPPPLTHDFPAEVLRRAERLGLGPVHLASAHDQVADLYAQAWRPGPEAPGDGEAGEEGQLRLPVALAPDAPAPLREMLALYLRLPFVNSAGVRDLPSFAEEDALVELFDVSGAAPPGPLLEALGLPIRRGLSRVRIERALAARGVAVVDGLGLDPAAFRLVCIPCDLHLRVGLERGWGEQPTWTHFDGHMVTRDRHFLALAGGDARFGGVYDVVGLDRDYDAERLLVRFAVVLRRRQEAW